MEDSLAMAHTFSESEEFSTEKDDLLSSFATMQADSTSDDYVAYVLQHIYMSWWDSLDYPYVERILQAIPSAVPSIQKLVDTYITSFSFDRMDAMDKALFTLWYIEYKEFHTPKEVILNELVELAKRYADPGSGKLINGIMHKILADIV